MVTFIGPHGVKTYVAMVLRSGLQLYDQTGMRPNKAWTPGLMLKRATSITGKSYKRGDYQQAIDDLTIWIDENGALE